MSELKVKTEIWSRVSGFFRPVSHFNKGKKEEFSERRKLQFDKEDNKSPET